jgi:serine/threonine-protein kinase
LSGSRAGAYVLLDEIGQGGMGRVFRAVREDAGVRQEVAVKLLRREMIDTEMLARFQAERRILAGLNHPAIARLLDFGETDDGIPYVAMELVRGEPIIEHCARFGLDLRERLALFQQVLAAVAHAHRNLIVHRDIKPANILVGESGQVKLLDFGIAKALQAPSEATATQMRYLTPNYASPEQFVGGPISVMTDVYALGAVLYELLTGRPPLRLDGLSAAEIENSVLHRPPETLERAANSAGDAVSLGRDDLASWRRSLRGDLDSIAQKALRKEPSGRYLSVEAFADDLRRYLDGHPVLASGNRRAYRIAKFVRRHRMPIAVLGVALLSVGLALAAALRQASVAAAERDGAQAAMAVLSESFRSVDPWAQTGGQISAEEILAAATRQTEALRTRQPRVHAALMAEIGDAELALGIASSAAIGLDAARRWAQRHDAALAERLSLLHIRRLLAAREIDQADVELRALEAHNHSSAALLIARSQQLVAAQRVDAALVVGRRALTAAMREPGSRAHVEATWQLAEAQRAAGDIDAAVASLDSLLDVFGADNLQPRALLTRMRRIRMLHAGERVDANTHLETGALVVALSRQYSSGSWVMGWVHSEHALALETAGKIDAAIAAHEQSIAALETALGRGHGSVLMARYNLADQLAERGSPRAPEAFERVLQEAGRAGRFGTSFDAFVRLEYANRLIEWNRLGDAKAVILPAGFAPKVDRLRAENRQALSDILDQLFGPFDCARPASGESARAAALACAARLSAGPTTTADESR